jgi:hypothetical protein
MLSLLLLVLEATGQILPPKAFWSVRDSFSLLFIGICWKPKDKTKWSEMIGSAEFMNLFSYDSFYEFIPED